MGVVLAYVLPQYHRSAISFLLYHWSHIAKPEAPTTLVQSHAYVCDSRELSR